jgi:hypothetical protein
VCNILFRKNLITFPYLKRAFQIVSLYGGNQEKEVVNDPSSQRIYLRLATYKKGRAATLS